DPPQSASVSLPLRTPSVQLFGAQTPPVQMAERQSPSVLHRTPRGQPAQEPPQSLPVSLPSMRPLPQCAPPQALTSAGQARPAPSQVSVGSQAPVEARHVVVAGSGSWRQPRTGS